MCLLAGCFFWAMSMIQKEYLIRLWATIKALLDLKLVSFQSVCFFFFLLFEYRNLSFFFFFLNINHTVFHRESCLLVGNAFLAIGKVSLSWENSRISFPTLVQTLRLPLLAPQTLSLNNKSFHLICFTCGCLGCLLGSCSMSRTCPGIGCSLAPRSLCKAQPESEMH